MKRIIALFIAAVMTSAVILTGCGSNSQSSDAKKKTEKASEAVTEAVKKVANNGDYKKVKYTVVDGEVNITGVKAKGVKKLIVPLSLTAKR
ncbi:MAG: hypothetical protein IIU39_04830 [Ruminococcus sp.]|nr:hypothetical protein [Ruminococcus sp.]